MASIFNLGKANVVVALSRSQNCEFETIEPSLIEMPDDFLAFSAEELKKLTHKNSFLVNFYFFQNI